MIAPYTGKKIVSPLDLPPITLIVSDKWYIDKERKKLTLLANFTDPCQDKETLGQWKYVISEVYKLLDSNGLILPSQNG